MARKLDKILITGAEGFVGKHLTKLYRGCQKDVLAYGKHELDVTETNQVYDVLEQEKPDVVHHLAGCVHVGESWHAPEEYMRVNLAGTANVLKAVETTSPKTIVHIVSSSTVYGHIKRAKVTERHPIDPQTPYDVTKLASEYLAHQYAKNFGVKTIVTRSFNHTGPGQSGRYVCADFARQVAECMQSRRRVIHVGNMEAVRDFTDVRDMVRAYKRAVECCEFDTVYNVCSGKGTSVQRIMDILVSYAGKKITLRQDPNRMRPSDTPRVVGSYEKFHAVTGWKPEIPLEVTLEGVLREKVLEVE